MVSTNEKEATVSADDEAPASPPPLPAAAAAAAGGGGSGGGSTDGPPRRRPVLLLSAAHRDACFRLARLPRKTPSRRVESYWAAATAALAEAAEAAEVAKKPGHDEKEEKGSRGSNAVVQQPPESQIMQALLLVRLLLIFQDDGDDGDEDEDGENSELAPAANLRRNLWTDMLRVRRFLIESLPRGALRCSETGPGAPNDRNSGISNNSSSSGRAPVPGVLSVAVVLHRALAAADSSSKIQDSKEDEEGDPPSSSPRFVFASFVSKEDARRCAGFLKSAVTSTLDLLKGRGEWGYLWDETATRYCSNHVYKALQEPHRWRCCRYTSTELQVFTWQWSCYLASSPSASSGRGNDDDGGDDSVTKNGQRIASYCASLALLVAITQMREGAQDSDDDATSGDSSSSGNKRARNETPLEFLVEEVSKRNSSPSGFTRWINQPSQFLNISFLGLADNENDDDKMEEEEDEKEKPASMTIQQISSKLRVLVDAIWEETDAIRKDGPPALIISDGDGDDDEDGRSSVNAPFWIREHVSPHVFGHQLQRKDVVTTWADVWKYLPYSSSRLCCQHQSPRSCSIDDDDDDDTSNLLDPVDLVQSTDTLQPLAGGLEHFAFSLSKEESTSPLSAIAREAVTPPIYTESMEVNEWILSLLSLDLVHPSKQLQTYLNDHHQRKALVWKASLYSRLQSALQRISKEYALHSTRIQEGETPGDSRIGIHEISGRVFCSHPKPNSAPEVQVVCKAVVAFFYHSLIAALCFCKHLPRGGGRVKSLQLGDDMVDIVLEDSAFDRALLSCCLMCVTKALGMFPKLLQHPHSTVEDEGEDNPGRILQIAPLPIYIVARVCQCSPLDFVNVSDLFVRSLLQAGAHAKIWKLQSPLPFVLPRLLVREMENAKVQVIDSLLWARREHIEKVAPSPESSANYLLLPDRIDQTRLSWWPPKVLVFSDTELPSRVAGKEKDAEPKKYPKAGDDAYNEYRYISRVVTTVLRLAQTRIRKLCDFLNVPKLYPVEKQVLIAFAYLLRHHIDALYDRHLDPFILCCMYGVCKTMRYKPELTFASIIDAYVAVRGMDLGDVTCQRIVRHIVLTPHDSNSKNDDSPPIGNVILLYNKVFVPCMKRHLLKSQSVKQATEALSKLEHGRKQRRENSPLRT